MMSRHARENIVSVLLLAVFAGVIILSLDFGPRARMIPLPLAVFGIVLTLIQLAWHNLGSAEALQIDMIEVQAPAVPSAETALPVSEPQKKSAWRQEAGAYAMVGILLALIHALGVFPAALLFTAGYFGLTGYCSWPRSLAYSGLLTASMYLLFVVALEMQPYHGLLAPLFQQH